MKKIFITIIAMLLPLLASAIKTDQLYYIYDSSTKTATLTRNQDWACYTGDIIVPSKVTYNNVEYTVTAIGEYALEGSTVWDASPSSVTIPNTVKSISKNAFYDSQLNSIYISDISAWCNISFGDSPSSYKLYVNGTLIKNLEIPSSVKSIGDRTFSGCKSLTTLTIPNSVTSIGDYAFSYCSGLTSVTIPNSVTSIGYEAFEGCSGLTSITIPSSVTSIGSYAFEGCSGLTSVTIPKSVTSIGYEAFKACSGLTSIIVNNGNTKYDSRNNCNAIIEKSSNTLKAGCKNTIIPNSVTSIGNYAFSGCSGLTSITIPNSVMSIGWEAFSGCSGLTSITIPNSVTSIGSFAFSFCSGLTSITIPNSVTSIGQDAFSGTGWYNNQPDGLVYAGKVAYKYKGTMPNNSSITIKDGTLGIAGSAFRGCNGLTSVTIPNSVTNIGFHAFDNCSGLTSITIPNSVTSIESYAFKDCSGLTSITIPNSVTSIGFYAFKDCSGLTSITIPSSVTSIGNSAFSYCRGLTSVTIPNSVTSIGQDAFSDCNNLQFICLTSDKYPSTQSLGTTNCQYIMPQSAFDGGIPNDIKNYATYGVTPMYVKVKSTTATSATLELTPIDIASGKTNETTTYEAKVYNLEPGAAVKGSWEIEGKDRGVVSFSNVNTKNLVMTVQAAQALSTTKAKLSATVNEPNDDKHYGFEWRRIGMDDLVPSNVVYSQLYDGHIVGTLSNLNPDISYKYRPFYKSDSGDMFYGDWIGFFTGDANVFFEPEVHTNEPVALTENGVQLSGVWIEGTEDTQEKGIEFWPKNSGARPVTRGGNVTAIIVKGNNTSVTLEGLEAGTEYVYRSYLRTASGTVYGEEKTFKTPLMGDANNDGKVNVADIVEVVNAKAGKPSASFNMTNADVDGNGSITEAEIVKIIMKK